MQPHHLAYIIPLSIILGLALAYFLLCQSKPQSTTQELRTRRQSLLRMFKETTDILNESGVPYYTAYGTLLGVVRHGEPIPWDDDLDFVLDKRYIGPDLLSIFEANGFKHSTQYQKRFGWTITKLYKHGEFVDLFHGTREGSRLKINEDNKADIPLDGKARYVTVKYGVRVRIPQEYMKYLYVLYGKDVLRTAYIGPMHDVPNKITSLMYDLVPRSFLLNNGKEVRYLDNAD